MLFCTLGMRLEGEDVGIDLEIWLHFGAVTEHLGKVDVFVVRLECSLL